MAAVNQIQIIYLLRVGELISSDFPPDIWSSGDSVIICDSETVTQPSRRTLTSDRTVWGEIVRDFKWTAVTKWGTGEITCDHLLRPASEPFFLNKVITV